MLEGKAKWLIIVAALIIVNIIICVVKGYNPLKYLKRHPALLILAIIIVIALCSAGFIYVLIR